jgi:hypothetical protein
MSAISPTYGVGADQFTDEDMELARRVVNLGAGVLDRYHQGVLDAAGYGHSSSTDPRQWWVGAIDWDTLSMFQEHYCILGQLFGSYSEGIKTLVGSAHIDTGVRTHPFDPDYCVSLVELNAYWATAMGFYTNEDDDEAIPYGALEIAWLEVRDDAVG